jgi:hypothetical protein
MKINTLLAIDGFDKSEKLTFTSCDDEKLNLDCQLMISKKPVRK